MKKVVLSLILISSFSSPFFSLPIFYEITQFVMSTISLSCRLSTFSDPIKEQQWECMVQKIDKSADRMGCPIDPGIKETVIILNLLGFTTNNSCEGHSARGRLYPFVSFTSLNKTVEDLENQRATLWKHIDKIKQNKEAGQEELDKLNGKLDTIWDKIKTIEMLELVPLKNFLTVFYKHHPIDRDTMLVINGCHLSSLSGNWQRYRDEHERLEKLQKYQEEMKLFTEFLIEYWKNL